MVSGRRMCGPTIDFDLITTVRAFASVEPCSVLIAGNDRVQERFAVKLRVDRVLVSINVDLVQLRRSAVNDGDKRRIYALTFVRKHLATAL